jgi:hypothetical protein
MTLPKVGKVMIKAAVTADGTVTITPNETAESAVFE